MIQQQPLSRVSDLIERLGIRPEEFARATGISLPTVRRRIQGKKIKVVQLGRLQIITRAELLRLGLIERAA